MDDLSLPTKPLRLCTPLVGSAPGGDTDTDSDQSRRLEAAALPTSDRLIVPVCVGLPS